MTRLEKHVQAEVKGALEGLGFHISDTSQGYRGGGRRNRSTRITKGVPDLYVTHARYRIRAWLEVKGEETPVTPEQRAWHARERESGGKVAVVRSAADAMWALHQWGVPLRPRSEPSDGIVDQFPELGKYRKGRKAS